MSDNIPCKDCITLAVCKERYKMYTGNYKDYVTANLGIRKHCSILQSWMNVEKDGRRRFIMIYNFYAEEREKI